MLCLARKGYKAPTICNLLKAENLSCTREKVFFVFEEVRGNHSIAGSGRFSKVTTEIFEQQIQTKQLRANSTGCYSHVANR